MTETQKTTTLDTIKAAAFPALIAIVVFFLIAQYNQFQSLSKSIEDLKYELASRTGRFDLIEFRLKKIEEKLDQAQVERNTKR